MARRGATSFDRIIGERLKRARCAEGLSQSELGSMVGITFQQIQKYERGTNRISVSTLQEICIALKLSTAYFLPETPNAKNFPHLDETSILLLKHFNEIPQERLRKQVLSLVKSLSS